MATRLVCERRRRRCDLRSLETRRFAERRLRAAWILTALLFLIDLTRRFERLVTLRSPDMISCRLWFELYQPKKNLVT